MPAFHTLDNLKVAGQRVIVRADLNVPIKENRVTDTTRIDRSAKTILELMRKGAKVIVISHFGRPKGRDLTQTLKPVVAPLTRAIEGKIVAFADDCIAESAQTLARSLKPGDVALLENLRFYSEEEKNDAGFARKLAQLGDLYVNDAFSCAHRAHASTEAIARYLPSAAGRLMQAELEALGKALESPKRPVVAIVGGAKVSTKLDLLGNLVKQVDTLVIGGGMANTFLFAQGIEIGNSLCERNMAETARAILAKAKKAGCTILLPTDVVVAPELRDGVACQVVAVDQVPQGQMILDFGPASAQAVIEKLSTAKTLVWNGPLGAFETRPFNEATNRVARTAADLTKAGQLLSVAGGGDTVSALAHAGVEADFSYISTAGGAFLEWLEGKALPGVVALAKSAQKMPLKLVAEKKAKPAAKTKKAAPAKKPAAKKAASAKKPAAKKTAVKKPAPKKPAAKKPVAKKPAAKKVAAKKPPAKKAPAKKPAAKKAKKK